MAFNFFTFGGSVFWEDVFFYQKWRIQRNCFTKKYRLLDSWDIRRAEGSFEVCQKAFIRYIETYEITKQSSKLIVLLHGYGDSKNIFKPLWRKFILTKSTVAALNYPSLFRSSLASAYQLAFFLNHMDDITDVSFVTKGSGNLILQHTFNLPTELQNFQEKMRIGNIVEINPVTKENLFCEFLTRFGLFRFILGPMLVDFTKKNLKNLPSLPSQFNVLHIYAETVLHRFLTKILKICHFPVEDETIVTKGSLYIKSNKFNMLHDEKLLNSTVKFIKNGKI